MKHIEYIQNKHQNLIKLLCYKCKIGTCWNCQEYVNSFLSDTFYHGTSEKNWKEIQEEGVLWGCYSWNGEDKRSSNRYRFTYLTPHIDISEAYGNIILEVNYSPNGIIGEDNFSFNPPPGETCWQFSVFKPIQISNVKIKKELKWEKSKL